MNKFDNLMSQINKIKPEFTVIVRTSINTHKQVEVQTDSVQG